MNKYYKVEDVEMLVFFSGICDDKTCGEVVKALQSLPTIKVDEDCVDRYSVLAELDPLSYEYKVIKELPSIISAAEQSSDRPQGEWVYIDEPMVDNPYGRYKCSECNLEEPYESDYCPNCGAYMKGVEDEAN